MKKRKLFFLLLVIIITIFSCNKNSNVTDTTVREKLTGKTWKVTQTGLDVNANGIVDEGELKFSDSTLAVTGMLNDNGTGNISFRNTDTSGSASLTWSLDASEKYITSTIPALSQTVVSKIITLTDMNAVVIADTSAAVKLFAAFTRQ